MSDLPGSTDGGMPLPAISYDGPHTICEHRAWLARQLLDSKLSDEEAYGIVRHSPAISVDVYTREDIDNARAWAESIRSSVTVE